MNRVDVWGLAEEDLARVEFGGELAGAAVAPVQPAAAQGPVLQTEMTPTVGPCYCRAYQGVAEQYLDSFLTLAQVYEAHDDLINQGAMLADWTLLDPEAVVNDAFGRLGRPDITATDLGVYPTAGDLPDNTDATVRRRDPDPGEVGHAQTGDAEGMLVFDPYPGASVNNYDLRAFRIDEEE